MFDKFYVGLDLTSSENNGKFKPVSRVTLLVDDENSYTAGDDTGIELKAPCAHATQAMADSILAKVKGHQYQAYSANDANLDPSAELGDGVTADGIYSVISRINDDGSGYAGLSAPGEAELEDEYPTTGPMTQEFNRKIAETRSTLTKTAEEIRLEVEKELEGLSASFSVQLDSITSRVEGAEGNISSLEQYVDSITLTVSNSGTSSTIALKAGNATISSQNITFSGFVTFTGLSSGTTTIDGACIKTGTIAAERLELSGAISFSDLSDYSIVNSTINSAASTADDAYDWATSAYYIASDTEDVVSAWQYGSTTYIDGSMLMTNTVRASTLEGGSVALLTSAENTAGVMTISGASTATYAVQLTSYGALRLSAESGDVFIEDGGGRYIQLSGARSAIVAGDGDLLPSTSYLYSLGNSSYLWSDVYCANATIQTSDLNKKRSVVYGLDSYESFFDALQPISFIFNDGTSGRRHMGLGAQDVECALTECGLTSMDFAGLIKSPRKDDDGTVIEGEYDYALRYGEFIPIMIEQIHKLKQKVAEMEEKYG